MSELIIKTESLPIRCDICHLNDLYDPHLNYCRRCSDTLSTLTQSEGLKVVNKANQATNRGLWFIKAASGIFLLIGMLILFVSDLLLTILPGGAFYKLLFAGIAVSFIGYLSAMIVDKLTK